MEKERREDVYRVKKRSVFCYPSTHAQFCCVTLIFRQQEIKLTVVSECGGWLYIGGPPPPPQKIFGGWGGANKKKKKKKNVRKN
jgi:hypothetical protein